MNRARSVTAYLGLGANLGDREQNIADALRRLAQVPGITLLKTSSLRVTAPVGGPPQDDYLNGVVCIETTLPPEALLSLCKELEREAGRDDGDGSVCNAPRCLDLDILLYGDQVIDTLRLQVPHPRLHEREFVLTPLQELGVDLSTIPVPERPVVLRTPAAVRAHVRRWRRGGCCIGLVPTMGALHEGHASLFRRARQDCDRVLATIFVNPLQFGSSDDLEVYPRTLDGDLHVLATTGVDAVFVPSAETMFADGFCSQIAVGAEARDLEGEFRQGHFAGVVTVVCKLASLAGADYHYYGQKDAQQVAVLRRLYRDLDLDGKIVECPIQRESDGLALSSRNVILSAEDRAVAPVLYRALCAAQSAHTAGERQADVLLATARAALDAESRCTVDYLQLRTEGSLLPLASGPVQSARLLVAARFGSGARTVRLIDNLAIGRTS